jgi:hypothetical protein
VRTDWRGVFSAIASWRVSVLAIATFCVAFGFGAGVTALLRGSAEGESPSAQPVLTPEAKRSFEQLRAGLGPQVAVTVEPVGNGKRQNLGAANLSDSPGAPAGSDMDAAVVVRFLLDRGGVGHLTALERGLLVRFMETGDSNDANAIFKAIADRRGGAPGAAAAAVEDVLHSSGDRKTHVQAPAQFPPGGPRVYGQTPWSSEASAHFMRELARGCVLREPDDAAFVLTGLTRSPLEGGWRLGPVPDRDGMWTARRTGLVGRGRSSTVVAVVVRGQTPPLAMKNANGVVGWLNGHLTTSQRPPATMCR